MHSGCVRLPVAVVPNNGLSPADYHGMATTRATTSKYLTTGQAAKELGTSRQHVWSLCVSGQLEAFEVTRPGAVRRQWLIPRVVVEAQKGGSRELIRPSLQFARSVVRVNPGMAREMIRSLSVT